MATCSGDSVFLIISEHINGARCARENAIPRSSGPLNSLDEPDGAADIRTRQSPSGSTSTVDVFAVPLGSERPETTFDIALRIANHLSSVFEHDPV